MIEESDVSKIACRKMSCLKVFFFNYEHFSNIYSGLKVYTAAGAVLFISISLRKNENLLK